MPIRSSPRVAVAVVALALASAAAPRAVTAADRTTTPVFSPGEEIELAIDYHHVRTATARILVGRPEGAVWPVICQARTDGIATLLDIREHYVSYWDSESRLPRGSDLNAIEVGDRHTDRVRFDRASGKVVVTVLRNGKLHENTVQAPTDAHDLASALLAIRSQPLSPGARFAFPVFTGTDTFTLEGQVEGTEPVETPAGRFETYRVAVQLGFKGRFRTEGASHVWISTDRRRVPVRMRADFAVGSATAILSRYRAGLPIASAP